MADDQFLTEMLRGIQASISDLRSYTEQRMDKLEERMGNLEKRQTASAHFEQSVLAHLASIHDSMDAFRAELVGFDRRFRVLEAH